MTRKILSYLALVICEAVMIAAFILYGGNMPVETMVLDIVVCTILLGLLFFDLLRPWRDPHTARVGSMGVRWFMTIVYALLALGTMIVLNGGRFSTQLLVHGALLALLLLGMAAALRTKEQIVAVGDNEQKQVADRDAVKKAWSALLEKMADMDNFPDAIRGRVQRMVEELRYLTPTNNEEAMDTDRQLVDCANRMGLMVGDYRMNLEAMEQMLQKGERLLQRRRNQYSR